MRKIRVTALLSMKDGAGDRNRTDDVCVEDRGFAIKLRLQTTKILYRKSHIQSRSGYVDSWASHRYLSYDSYK